MSAWGGARTNTGGKREGAGRPIRSPNGKTIRRTVTLSPEADKAVKDHQCAGDSYAATIDRIVREWLATQG